MLIPEIKTDIPENKILGWLWSEVVVATLVTRGMDEGIELTVCMLIHGVRKAKSYFGMYMVKCGCDLLGPRTLKPALS